MGRIAELQATARDTWRFYSVDVDPTTRLPLDNLTFAGGSTTPTGYGHYTSAANIGMYLWTVAPSATPVRSLNPPCFAQVDE
jgi:hypothetical protein